MKHTGTLGLFWTLHYLSFWFTCLSFSFPIRIPGFGELEVNLEFICNCQCEAKQYRVSCISAQNLMFTKPGITRHHDIHVNKQTIKPLNLHFKSSRRCLFFFSLACKSLRIAARVVVVVVFFTSCSIPNQSKACLLRYVNLCISKTRDIKVFIIILF